MRIPRIIIAGTESGAGKTTVTIALIAAFRRLGLTVQPFKAGPDYIDPGFHQAAADRPSRCLDTWMLNDEALLGVVARGTRGADLAVVEGVMGLYDGKDAAALTGSTAELALKLQAPVLLVLDAGSMARSAAAVVLGFQRLEPRVRIAGVIVNRVGSEGHFQLLKEAIEAACGIPVVGYFRKQSEFALPERHLGLVPALEHAGLDDRLNLLAEEAALRFDLELIRRLADEAPELDVPEGATAVKTAPQTVVRIAVAFDDAFHFYYTDNWELLQACGAELLFFSPLRGESVPEQADGLYIGGGFPEQFAAELSNQTVALASLRERIEAGLPTFAECGGLMALARSLTTANGDTYPMAGVIPGRVRMQTELAALGYREVRAAAVQPLLGESETARGHEFHYSTIEYDEGCAQPSYISVSSRGGPQPEGYATPSLTAGYTHLHFSSNPRMAERFVQACRTYREEQDKSNLRKDNRKEALP